ncbi:MAG: Asp-tRNA(Asn)/Glu-tRNA(Gln) amidotransferase subunit GatB, partial [Bacteroidota bacterium]
AILFSPMSEQTHKKSYETVIGLEVHIQLKTHRKVFAPEDFVFGSSPNHHVSVVSLAHPGALPSPNLQCIKHMVKLGLALGCEIREQSYFSRKNYFYPDLPKGYQLSQDSIAICGAGDLDIQLDNGVEKSVRIERIHLEEDAGKSIHDIHPKQSLIDLNRAGVGLAELVTHPDLRSAEEAGAFVAQIRRIVRYLQISDGNMEEGSLRCDANVSVMPKGSQVYGTRVEIKNINSISQVIKAINYESKRQISCLEKGEEIFQETRTWNVAKGTTAPMRDKETAEDYRYFPEPDLQPIKVKEEIIEELRAEIPRLPQERFTHYQKNYKIPKNEARSLAEQREFSDYFEQLLNLTSSPKSAANWMLGPVRNWLNEKSTDIDEFPINTGQLAQLIKLVEDKKVGLNAAKEVLFPELLIHPEQKVEILAQEKDVIMESAADELLLAMQALVEKFPAETKKYKNGKKNLIGFFVGQLMRKFRGKADPKEVNEVVRKVLDS